MKLTIDYHFSYNNNPVGDIDGFGVLSVDYSLKCLETGYMHITDIRINEFELNGKKVNWYPSFDRLLEFLQCLDSNFKTEIWYDVCNFRDTKPWITEEGEYYDIDDVKAWFWFIQLCDENTNAETIYDTIQETLFLLEEGVSGIFFDR